MNSSSLSWYCRRRWICLNRAAVWQWIAYHSLEDRQVKRFIQDRSKTIGTDPLSLAEAAPVGPRLRRVTRKPVMPDSAEITANPRARSARLRVAERLT